MKAVTWQGKRNVSVQDVPDPKIEQPTDALLRITSSGLCGSDLHLYELLGPFLHAGDILGHEPMGIVEEVGSEVTSVSVGDRVVVPFQIACGACWMCEHDLQTQCETTQVRDQNMGAALFGYTDLYGAVPGAQAEYLRVPHANYGPIKVPHGPPDDRFVYLSDVLPTAWQAVKYADVKPGSSVAVLGLGPIGLMAARMSHHLGAEKVVGLDRVPARLQQARKHGAIAIDLADCGGPDDLVADEFQGRGPDAVIDAVGMEAHGSPFSQAIQSVTTLAPKQVGRPAMKKFGIDRLSALNFAIDLVRRGGTISVIGVYGGAADPLPLLTMFDKQIQLRMGQANVKRWVPELLPMLQDNSDPLGVDEFATHHLPLSEAANAYRDFQHKKSGTIKVLFQP